MIYGPIIFGCKRDCLLPAFHQLAKHQPVVLVRSPDDLTEELVEHLRPTWVFLPDWSWIVSNRMLGLAPFVGFHAADLPNYRGGSPLQHQILDGITDTKLTCFKMTNQLDAGQILEQQDLSLAGTIGDIWQRIASLVPVMIGHVLAGTMAPRYQADGGFIKPRRTPEESRIYAYEKLSLCGLYDWIRALDDPYPNAFTVHAGKRLTFSKPTFSNNTITATVEITKEPNV